MYRKIGVRVRCDKCRDSVDIRQYLPAGWREIGVYNTTGSLLYTRDFCPGCQQ